MKRFIHCMVLTMLCFPAKFYAQENISLVNGNPLLTQLMVGKTIVLLDWVLDLKLSKDQELQIKEVLISSWKNNNRGEIKSTLDAIDVYEQIVKLGEAERNKIKEKMQPQFLADLYKEPGDKLARRSKKQKEEDDKWVSYNYSGPKDILGLFPVFSISFCDDAKDSVFMQPPINKPEDMALVTANSVAKAYTIDHTAFLGGLFLKGTEESAVEGEEIALETIAAYSANHLETPTGNAKLDKLQSEYNLAEKTKELQNKMSIAINQSSALILFDAQNKNEDIVDAEVSPSHTMPESEQKVKGKIKIKVVHDPKPYNQAPKRKPLKKIIS